MDNEQQGLTRRQMLKRGAALGGALVWAVPVVQTIGMTPALAQTPSPVPGGCDTHYAIKVGPGGCEDIYLQTADKGEGHCLDVVNYPGVEAGGCKFYSPLATGYASDNLSSDGPVPWVVAFTCKVKILDYSVKSGSKAFEGDVKCGTPGWKPDGNQVMFYPPEQDISHIEIIFCCDGAD